jgi:tRNA(His) 5'-end guanylyltransferase
MFEVKDDVNDPELQHGPKHGPKHDTCRPAFKTEDVEAMFDTRLDPRKCTIFRLDGVGFSSFVKRAGCARPFDPRFTTWMNHVLQDLMTQYRFQAGFCGSDEITLVWYGTGQRHLRAVTEVCTGVCTEVSTSTPTPTPTPTPTNPDTFTMLYSGRVLKLCSVLAARASAAFTVAILRDPTFDGNLRAAAAIVGLHPTFDCRVWQVEDPAQAHDNLRQRQVFTLKNARMMFARSHLSQKQVHRLSSSAAAKLVQEVAGIKFEDTVPDSVRLGVYGVWQPVTREVRDTKEAHDAMTVTRRKVVLVPHFGTLVTV